MDPFEAIKATFFEECAELLETLEAGLLALQSGKQDQDTIDAVFRAVHSIKGGAGAFDLANLVAYAHEFESALDALRSGQLRLGASVVATFLRASDHLGDLVAAARSSQSVSLPDTQDLRDLVSTLSPTASSAGTHDEFTPILFDFGRDPDGDLTDPDVASREKPAFPVLNENENRVWEIHFEPLPDLLISGNEPLFLFRALEVMGHLEVEAHDGDLPALTEIDPRIPRLRWRILLTPTATDLTETEIENVFEFAVDLCLLTIRPITSHPSQTAGRENVAVTQERLTAPAPSSAERTGTLQASDQNSVPPIQPASTTIRVDLARVDRLVNLVGEMVISQSMLVQGMARADLDQHAEITENLDDLQQLTRDMQDSVMSIRAQPVKSLFQRMTRIVREAGHATQKDVCLVTEGEDTEIDKTVVERLADPLTHMIRNAIDHGLELPEERVAAGKSRTGKVRLTARQQSDRVIIEVSDDGRGIDRDRVLARAIERGLVTSGKLLDAKEIDRLLFLPGFSTNDAVTALSGRGVGMDVVQRSIRDLNGAISITSTAGQGCILSVSLPLTLAILDGMIVRTHRHRMVVPLSVILETQILAVARIEQIGQNQTVVQFNGRFVPLIDLAIGMGFSNRPPESRDDSAIIFVQPNESAAFALQVDAIEAQRQVVIKGLGENFGRIPCVSAATILGDGQVALIVDPAGISTQSGLRNRASGPEQEVLAS